MSFRNAQLIILRIYLVLLLNVPQKRTALEHPISHFIDSASSFIYTDMYVILNLTFHLGLTPSWGESFCAYIAKVACAKQNNLENCQNLHPQNEGHVSYECYNWYS